MSATPSVSDIAAALGGALGSISGLRVVDYLSDTISPPAAVVAIETVNYHGAFGDADVEHEFTVYLVVSRVSDRAGAQAMESYMSQAGAQSVREALEADPTLDGAVSTLWVEKSGPPGALSIGDAEYISLPFTVHVHA